MPKHAIPLSRRQRANSLLWATVSLLFGWTLFGYWWSRVLIEDQPRPLIGLIQLVALFGGFILLGTLIWIWHNRRLARRGKRGMAARYSVPDFDTDVMGRAVTFPIDNGVRKASVVVVSTSEDGKMYTADGRTG